MPRPLPPPPPRPVLAPLGLVLVAASGAGCAGPRAASSASLSLATVPRVSPEAVRARVEAGQALLVCAFAAEDRCFRDTLKRAILLSELKARMSRLARSRELVFYCACAGDSTALHVAAWARAQGFTNVKVLRGGPQAWGGLDGVI